MQKESDFRGYWRLVTKWWWIFLMASVIGLLLGGFFGYWNQRSHIDIYSATTKLLVEGGGANPALSSNARDEKRLVEYYDDLVKTRPFLKQVASQLPSSVDPSSLPANIDVVRPGTLIEIRAKDTDPAIAAQIANTIGQTLIADLRDRQFSQIAQIQASLSQYGILQDSSTTASQLSGLVTLAIAEDALTPTNPANKRGGLGLPMTFGLLLGIFIAGAGIFIREELDDRINSPEELKASTELDALGWVMHYQTKNGGPINLDLDDRLTPLADSYRFLLTNLEFAASRAAGPLGKILITSSSPGEGKTTTAINLAASMARQGKSVILVDTDLRRPTLHRVYQLEDRRGLTNLILGTADMDIVLHDTPVPGLQIIPAGAIPPDPTYILRSELMKQLSSDLGDRADIIVFDSPPLLVATDPLLVAPYVDAALIVIDTQRTGAGVAKRGVDILRQANPPLIAAVLNKIKSAPGDYYYQYYDYYTEDSHKPTLKDRLLFRSSGRRSNRDNS